MADIWKNERDTLTAPARNAVAVTPSDTADLPQVARALWVSGAGTVQACAVDSPDDAGMPYGNLPAGAIIPVRIRRVKATGTSATVLALY